MGRNLNREMGLPGGQDLDPGPCPLPTSLQRPSDSCLTSFQEKRTGGRGEGWAGSEGSPHPSGCMGASLERALLKELEAPYRSQLHHPGSSRDTLCPQC